MFSRLIHNLSIIRGQSLSKSKYVAQSFSTAVKLRPQRAIQKPKSCFIISRLCTTTTTSPNKNEIAIEQLEKYLEDADNERHYKVLQLEVDVMRQSGEKVPDTLKPRHWMELIQLNSRGKRRKYLNFLFGLEKKKEHQMEKKKRSLEELEKKNAASDSSDSDIPSHLKYGLGGNSCFLRFYESTMNNMYNWKLHRAAMYNQKLVFDCGYEDKMAKREIKNCARQLQMAFGANRAHDQPFDIHFCNFDTKGYLHQELYSFLPTMYQPEFPINITEKSYLDLFDRNKLIYLTPDAKETMNEFDRDAVYIIGALVDKTNSFPLSLAKAKREGIRMVKLPIDRYLHFGSGSGKNLTLNQMIDILTDVQMTGDWVHSLRHIPRRKLYTNRQQQSEKRLLNMYRNSQTKNAPSNDYTIHGRKKFRDECN